MKAFIVTLAVFLLTLISMAMTTMAGLFINMTNLEFLGWNIIIICLASIVLFSRMEVENV
ncbi:hypothetical protein ETI10_01570 [Macrococcoides goetzii]|nr:hypothetical protein [Macrococcus goetzii]TDM41803.1 hypothetical protein ETI10_01570 [Macrococcus goetzii]